MIIRSPASYWPLARQMLLVLWVAVLVAIGSGTASSGALQQPAPPASPAPSDQDGSTVHFQHDASLPGRYRHAAQTEWRLRLLQILIGPYTAEHAGPFPK